MRNRFTEMREMDLQVESIYVLIINLFYVYYLFINYLVLSDKTKAILFDFERRGQKLMEQEV